MTRLAVSNIAWPAEDDPAAYGILRDAGVRGLEIAPTRIWPGWEGAVPAAARRLRRELEGAIIEEAAKHSLKVTTHAHVLEYARGMIELGVASLQHVHARQNVGLGRALVVLALHLLEVALLEDLGLGHFVLHAKDGQRA